MGATEPEALLVALIGAVLQGFLFAQPPNVTYFVDEERCSLHVTWLPVESRNSRCTWNYKVNTRVNGDWNDPEFELGTSWTNAIPLGQKIDFGVKTVCMESSTNEPDWNDDETFSVLQKGTPGTGARNISCIWWNRKHMECSWLSGEDTSPNTSYKLSCWYPVPAESAENEVCQCRNVTHQGSVFQCSFELDVDHVEWISISVQGNSGHIQTMCLVFYNINTLVKLNPPFLSPPSKTGSEVFLQWTQPAKLGDLEYGVEVNGSKSVHKDFRTPNAKFPIDPTVRHTFRVRVKTSIGHWSDWSNMEFLDSSSFVLDVTTLLFILIPLCMAVLFVIALIYLQRIKLLILPKIPDPGKILKQIFDDQNDNQPTHETGNSEETHTWMLVEPAGNEKQGN